MALSIRRPRYPIEASRPSERFPRARGWLTLWGLLLCGSWATEAAGAADRIPIPPMAPVERGEYRARDAQTGEELWRHRWLVERRSADERTTIRASQEGRKANPSQRSWEVLAELTLSDARRLLSVRREARDDSGVLQEIEERVLDYPGRAGRIAVLDPRTGRIKTRHFPVTETTIDGEMLAAWLRLLPETEGQRARFDLITGEGRSVAMEARIIARETVEVPLGRIDCYKLEIAPSGLVGTVVGLLLGRMYMWHTAALPHIWVKYQGPEDGVGSREIVRELIRFEPRPR